MSDVCRFVGRLCAIAGALALSAPVVMAQQMFDSASGSTLSGTPGDALPIVILADIGAYPGGGPPDQKLDIITALQGPMTAYVLFGKGDGTFPTDNGGTQLNRIPTALLLDDMDGGVSGNGKDMIVAETGSVAFMHGNNDGTFADPDPTPPHTLQDRGNWVCVGHTCAAPVAAQVVALAAADVNGDGKKDLVAIDNAGVGGAMVLLGNGDGTFTPGNLFAAAGLWAVVAGDFNNDGAVDLAVTNRNTDAVNILRGDGHGVFTSVQTLSVTSSAGGDPFAIASGELNGDGKPDLVVADQTADNIAVFLTQGDGFQAAQFYDSGTKGSSPNGVTLAYVNQDNKLDAVVSNGASSDISTLLGDGTGKFGPPRAFVADQEPQAVAVGDLNGDTLSDAVTITQDGQAPRAMVLRGNGDGSYAAVENVMVPANPKFAVAGDVDNDGLPDLIVVPTTPSGEAGTILIRRALRTGGFATAGTLQSHGDVLALGVGDFNGDGQLDVVALNGSTQDLSLFLATGIGLPSTPTTNLHVAAGAQALAVGDWNGDGLSDVAVMRQASGAGAIDILVSSGGGFQAKPLIALTSAPEAIEFGDFNNDGKLDLVVANDGAHTLSVVPGNGDGTFQAAVAVTIPGVTGSATSLTAADFDGDGNDDIGVLVAGSDLKALVLYGPTFSTASNALPQGDPPSTLIARDLTGDLIPDLLVTNQGQANAVVPYQGTRPSKVFTKVTPIVPVGRMPASLATADFDGDGRYDAATANNTFAGTVSVLTNIRATPAIIRGDGNGDGKVSAADLVAVARQLGTNTSTRVEKLMLANGTFPNAKAGADANGDGVVTGQDIFAIAFRLFPPL